MLAQEHRSRSCHLSQWLGLELAQHYYGLDSTGYSRHRANPESKGSDYTRAQIPEGVIHQGHIVTNYQGDIRQRSGRWVGIYWAKRVEELQIGAILHAKQLWQRRMRSFWVAGAEIKGKVVTSRKGPNHVMPLHPLGIVCVQAVESQGNLFKQKYKQKERFY